MYYLTLCNELMRRNHNYFLFKDEKGCCCKAARVLGDVKPPGSSSWKEREEELRQAHPALEREPLTNTEWSKQSD